MSDQARLGGIDGSMSPMPQAGASETLIASGTLTQSFASNISTVVSVQSARRCVLLARHTAHASQSDGEVHLLVMLSNEVAQPAVGDDVWYALPVYDATPTDADIAAGATLPTGADYSKGPTWAQLAAGGLILKTRPASSSEVVRQRFPFDVTDARWMYVAAIQQGDTTNFGTIAVDYALSL